MINILKHRDENLVRLYKYFLPYKGKIAIASIFLIATALTSSATATLLGKLTPRRKLAGFCFACCIDRGHPGVCHFDSPERLYHVSGKPVCTGDPSKRTLQQRTALAGIPISESIYWSHKLKVCK